MEKDTLLDKITKIVSVVGNFIMMNLPMVVLWLPAFILTQFWGSFPVAVRVVLLVLTFAALIVMGQVWSATFSGIRYHIRGDKWTQGFVAGFKNRFWRATAAWSILLVFTAITLFDVLTYSAVEVMDVQNIVRLVVSCLMFALVSGLAVACLLLNVYIPTAAGEWIRNSVNMVFKAPLLLMVSGLAIWLPVLLAILFYNIFYYCIMIFVVIYFTLAALGITMLMKETLIYYLLDARAKGILLSDTKEEDDGEV